MNKLTLIAFSLPFLSACSPSMPELPDLPDMPDIIPDLSLPDLYKPDMYQGSVLNRFKINQLEIGMSEAQVQDLIGSPSVIDPFHNNQWDYINHSTPFKGKPIHYRLILKLKNGKLASIDTSGISSLPQLTDKEKELEDKRIAEEKARIEAARIAKEKELARIAEEKARIEAARIAKEKELARIAEEKAEAQRVAKEKAKLKAELAEAERVNNKKSEAKEEQVEVTKEDKPWYKFW